MVKLTPSTTYTPLVASNKLHSMSNQIGKFRVFNFRFHNSYAIKFKLWFKTITFYDFLGSYFESNVVSQCRIFCRIKIK